MNFWALRDFYAQRVKNKSKTEFDKNLENLFRLRDEEIEGYHTMRYESPYFKAKELKKLDDLYEDFRARASEKGTMAKFLRLIKDSAEKSLDF